MPKLLLGVLAIALFCGCTEAPPSGKEVAVSVSFSDSLGQGPLDGRLLLTLSEDPGAEPRFQIGAGLNTQLVFGMNVEGIRPGESVVFDGDTELPNPLSRLRYNSMYVPRVMKRIAKSAPEGEDLESWRYC